MHERTLEKDFKGIPTVVLQTLGLESESTESKTF